ncbi:WAT1-related protein At1g68170-like [Diospyros lotus]|uniref:WAT1-related protein At1g68170-like n=1 Tax=Diospyros lotus TaxID=55363 RepID=UPI00225C0F2E|nr:WAT1-related protein At1g68170-like [Diospyros lotus]
MRKIWNTIHGLRPAMLMVVVQATFAGVNVFYKLAANDGMSLRVLVAYRFLFAAAFIVPIAIIVERRRRPKLTWKLAGQAFLVGLLVGTAAQNLYLGSLVLTSATFASAMTNLVPAITFVLAISFGLEKLGWGTVAGKAKVAGTLMCIGGAMLLTFYKGVEINLWSTDLDLLHSHSHNNSRLGSGNLKLGAILSVCCCFSSAIGLILQAKMIQGYPCPYSTTAMVVTMGAIQSVGFAVCMERDWEQWKLGWNIRLLSASYSGIVASGVMLTFMAWCVQMRGPLFVSVFNPLMLVLVAIAGSLLLDEKLHLGSVLGAGVIVLGLYTVLWGKGKELKRMVQLMPSKSSREFSERIEITVTATTTTTTTTSADDHNINNIDVDVNSSSSGSTIVIDPNGIPVVYSNDALDAPNIPTKRLDSGLEVEEEEHHEEIIDIRT